MRLGVFQNKHCNTANQQTLKMLVSSIAFESVNTASKNKRKTMNPSEFSMIISCWVGVPVRIHIFWLPEKLNFCISIYNWNLVIGKRNIFSPLNERISPINLIAVQIRLNWWIFLMNAGATNFVPVWRVVLEWEGHANYFLKIALFIYAHAPRRLMILSYLLLRY